MSLSSNLTTTTTMETLTTISVGDILEAEMWREVSMAEFLKPAVGFMAVLPIVVADFMEEAVMGAEAMADDRCSIKVFHPPGPLNHCIMCWIIRSK
jgi:hypothetical protein